MLDPGGVAASCPVKPHLVTLPDIVDFNKLVKTKPVEVPDANDNVDLNVDEVTEIKSGEATSHQIHYAHQHNDQRCRHHHDDQHHQKI